MPVTCEIVPVENLEPQQYRQLATSLAQWCQAESGRRRDVLVEMEGRALGDLRNGQLPRPLAERMAEAGGVDLAQVQQHLGDRSASRGIEVRVHCEDPHEVVGSIRQALPAEWIDALLIDGCRWET